MNANSITPTLAEAFARKQGWATTTQSNFLGSLATAFRWAVKARLIAVSPLLGLLKPPKASRGAEALLTPEEYALLLKHANKQFALFLRVAYATGCRPSEAAAITAENFNAEQGLVRLTEHKTAHTGKVRVLYLTPEIVTLLAEQRERYGNGVLLRNKQGIAWKRKTLERAMRYTRQRAGLPHATCYCLRHTYATDALANGVPDAHVAELLGHSGTAMLHRHYSHLTARTQALRQAAQSVR